ncbi:unnamed protein product [Heligmosomoides polygyrus]|uniref:Secreted protein n=1 Tax=Heligmosomoides polygyrus TaxID=6339 RepID=A0A183FJQ2_HELPZ|nr:unnamed protein product [Heligmosomoides polygyrus]
MSGQMEVGGGGSTAGLLLAMLIQVFGAKVEKRSMGWTKAHGLWGKRSAYPEIALEQVPPYDNSLNTAWRER